MKNKFKCAVDRVGKCISVYTGKGIYTGRAVVYPIRNETKSYGDMNNEYEGICDSGRYEMFCDSELLKYAVHGDTVICGENSYVLLWKDEFSCRAGSYMKSCLKKVENGE